jgi:hypothetical protein
MYSFYLSHCWRNNEELTKYIGNEIYEIWRIDNENATNHPVHTEFHS